MKIIETPALTFDDVSLVPQYSESRSRKAGHGITISTTLGKGAREIKLEVPFIASPMNTVVHAPMAATISKLGGLAILHRYCTIEKQVEEYKKSIDMGATIVGAALGANTDYIERAEALVNAGCKILCIDTAHGHHIMVGEALFTLRKKYPFLHIMVGNVATAEGFSYLQDLGADSIRANIGSGSICATRLQTGHGLPALQTIFDVAPISTTASVIVDGGIRNGGDAVKGLGAGAHAIMMGSMFAGTDETPGEVFEKDGCKYKKYAGMASKETQLEWRGFYTSDEGVSHHVKYKGPVAEVVKDLSNYITTGLSYSGSTNLTEFHKKATFRIQTLAGHLEGLPHILRN